MSFKSFNRRDFLVGASALTSLALSVVGRTSLAAEQVIYGSFSLGDRLTPGGRAIVARYPIDMARIIARIDTIMNDPEYSQSHREYVMALIDGITDPTTERVQAWQKLVQVPDGWSNGNVDLRTIHTTMARLSIPERTFRVKEDILDDQTLFMNMHDKHKTTLRLVGGCQLDILDRATPSFLPSKRPHTIKSYNTVTIPMIYPGLRKYFPQSLDELLAQRPQLGVPDDRTRNIIVIQRVPGGQPALALYHGGYLVLLTHCAVGRGSPDDDEEWKTPRGHFMVQVHESARTSNAFNDAPMNYCLLIDEARGVYTHMRDTGGPTPDTSMSHGCVGLPGLYARELYLLVGDETEGSSTEVLIASDIYPS